MALAFFSFLSLIFLCICFNLGGGGVCEGSLSMLYQSMCTCEQHLGGRIQSVYNIWPESMSAADEYNERRIWSLYVGGPPF